MRRDVLKKTGIMTKTALKDALKCLPALFAQVEPRFHHLTPDLLALGVQ